MQYDQAGKRSYSISGLYKYILLLIVILNLYPFADNCALAVRNIGFQADSSDVPWKISADNIQVDRDKNTIIARGRVSIQKGNKTLNSDYAVYNWESKQMQLRGDFRAEMDGAILNGNQAKFDLQTEKGWIKRGSTSLQDPHLIFRGDKISKSGRREYSYKNASVTACDGEIPFWSITSSRGEIPLKGYASLWHNKFLIKDYPVFYFPYLLLPVENQKQSGFLPPRLSSSSRDGFGVTLPYYLVLNSEQDITLAANQLSQRGTRLISEYRLTPDPRSEGLFRLEWIKDRITADTEEEEYSKFDNDGLTRDNSHRFWLRGKYNGFFPKTSFRTRLDLDLVSDQNYLREFDYGRYGYEASHDDFMDKFGRDINNKDEIVRENTWILRKRLSNSALFESRFEYNQNSSTFNENFSRKQDPTIQKLPELSLDIYKNRIAGTPFQWEAENKLTHYWRRSGNKGIKLNTFPSITLPLSGRYFSSILEAGWEESIYYNQDSDKEEFESKEFLSRGTGSVYASLFGNIFNTLDLEPSTDLAPERQNEGNQAWTKIKHSVKPQLEYSFQSSEQNDVPAYALQDTRSSENKITFSLINSLSRRKEMVVKKPNNSQGEEYKIDKDYREFLLLDLEQSFHIRETDRKIKREKYPRRPFSDIRARLIYNPGPFFHLDSSTWFSPGIGEITEHENILNMNYRDIVNGYLGFDYQNQLDHYIHRKDQSELSILRLGTEISPNRQWTFNADYSRDLKNSQLLEQSLGVTYTHQCWNLDLEYTQDSHESSISLQINLSELGEQF